MEEQILKHFNEKEVVGLDKNLCLLLDLAREYAGIPFVVTSGLRTKEENQEAGGVVNSAHLKGLACDISAENSTQRFFIVKGALEAGFKRIGIANDHIHLDIDSEKPQEVLFLE